jgi:8-oxo-dGTP pyrophosphatase MutT (NUDIX family)
MPDSLYSADPNSSGDLLALMRRRFVEGVVAPPVSESSLRGEDRVLTPAAVLVPVVVRSTGPTVLLTQRTAHLRDHAGQVSFPGGRCEDGDASPEHTALREAEEEVGLDPARSRSSAACPNTAPAPASSSLPWWVL